MNTIYTGDCIDVMKGMPDDSVDSIVTDPPYELGFMGKSWDSTGIANSVEMWSEALRVLKPGGHLLAFSGSRTYHRMACAIEDAGFEIRDQIMWVYGSGFPKSHNISKGIDKTLNAPNGEVIGQSTGQGYSSQQEKNLAEGFRPYTKGLPSEHADKNIYALSSPEAQQWEGWGTALKPAHEPIVLARKPLIGTVANNVLAHGTGGINIDGCRVGSEERKNNINDFTNQHGNQFGNGQPIAKIGESKVTGRFPANFIHDGSDEVLELFPQTKSSEPRLTTKQGGSKNRLAYGDFSGQTEPTVIGFGDSGSTARFFYCAKTSKRDRNEGLDGFEAKQQDESRKEGNPGGDNPRNRGVNKVANFHPTVKPNDLMRYLVRLVTPPNGTVLDPFMGSGSTGKAAILEGFDFIGIDMTPEYVEIARARIEFAMKDKDEDEQGTLF